LVLPIRVRVTYPQPKYESIIKKLSNNVIKLLRNNVTKKLLD